MPQLHLAPPQETVEAIRKMAAKEGISVNAMLVPYLNEIARGELVRASYWPGGEPRPTLTK